MFPIPHQIHLTFHNPRAELGMSSSSPWGELMNNLGKSPRCYLIWEAPHILVTAHSCDTKGPAVYCVPETPAFINSYKVVHLLWTNHFLYLIYLFLSIMPYSLHLFQFSVQSLCFQMELLDNTLPPNDWISEQHVCLSSSVFHICSFVYMSDYLIYYYFPGQCQGHSGFNPV